MRSPRFFATLWASNPRSLHLILTRPRLGVPSYLSTTDSEIAEEPWTS